MGKVISEVSRVIYKLLCGMTPLHVVWCCLMSLHIHYSRCMLDEATACCTKLLHKVTICCTSLLHFAWDRCMLHEPDAYSKSSLYVVGDHNCSTELQYIAWAHCWLSKISISCTGLILVAWDNFMWHDWYKYIFILHDTTAYWTRCVTSFVCCPRPLYVPRGTLPDITACCKEPMYVT